ALSALHANDSRRSGSRSNRPSTSILRDCSATLHHYPPPAGQNTSPSLQVSLAPSVGSTTTPTAKHGSTKWKFKKSTLSPSLALCLYWSDVRWAYAHAAGHSVPALSSA